MPSASKGFSKMRSFFAELNIGMKGNNSACSILMKDKLSVLLNPTVNHLYNIGVSIWVTVLASLRTRVWQTFFVCISHIK